MRIMLAFHKDLPRMLRQAPRVPCSSKRFAIGLASNALVVRSRFVPVAIALGDPAANAALRKSTLGRTKSKGDGISILVSVRRLQAGLQSFLSMRRIEARRKNANAFRLRHSQSLARRRQRLSHAMVRSTIQRLGNTTKLLT